MSDSGRVKLFQLLSVANAVLSITALVLTLYENWRYAAGVAILSCLIYHVRIWLVNPLVKRNV